MKKIILALMLVMPLAAQTPPGETQITINSFSPTNVTADPQESSSFTNAFTTTQLIAEIKDTAGFGDVDKLQVVVSATQPTQTFQPGICSMRFDKQTQGFGLLLDSGAWSDAMLSNSYDGQENNQCTVIGQGTTVVSQSGQLIRVQFNVAFSPSFTGQMGLWVFARNAANTVNTGYIRKGTIRVNAPPSGIGGLTLTPVNQYQHIALMPYEQIEFDATCTQPINDPVSKLQLVFNPFPTAPPAGGAYNICEARYDAKNKVFNILLYVDTPCGQFCTYKVPTWSANIVPGSATSISSGACQLNGAGSYASGEGTTLFVAFNLTLSGNMSKNNGTSSNFEDYLFLMARNEANTVTTGYVNMGKWNIWQP